jgi:hypothetical protein
MEETPQNRGAHHETARHPADAINGKVCLVQVIRRASSGSERNSRIGGG